MDNFTAINFFQRNQTMKKQAGLTLIELMIVVAVVAVLASITYPSYQNYVKKARRNQAQSVMLDATNREQQYILDKRQYTNSFTAMNLTFDDYDCTSVATECKSNFYKITIAVDNTATPPEFTITATALNQQVSDGNLTLDSTGAKTPASKW